MSNLLQSKWHTVGWQGISLRVPEEWNIGGIGGSRDDGYLRLQDAELARVEIKWAQAEGFVNVNAMVEGYVKKLTKDKRLSRDIKVDTNAQVVSKRKMRKKGLQGFTWATDLVGHGAAWYCQDCKRTVIVQVTTRPDEKGDEVAERVIGSLQDHPREGRIRWATYGFDAETPDDFGLTSHKLMAGHIQLTFKRDVTARDARSLVLQNIVTPEELTLSRWGMANVLLKNKTLREWAESEMGKGLKRLKPEFGEAEVNGHEAVSVSAQKLMVHQYLARLISRFADAPYADRVSGLIWHCPEHNSVHLVQMLVDVSNSGLPAELAATFRCHQDDEAEE